jgi:L-serine dehydratase
MPDGIDGRMEAISVFDIFKIGVGPSSSHTLGPWRAAQRFVESCRERGFFDRITKLRVDLYGSLAKTGKGHGTDIALMMGFFGENPAACDTAAIPEKIAGIRATRSLLLAGSKTLAFDPDADLVFNRAITLPFHPNGMKFTAELEGGNRMEETFFSIGGGVIARENEPAPDRAAALPLPMASASDLLRHCREGLTLPEVVRRNEQVWRGQEEVSRDLARIWDTMRQCVFRGCHAEGVLPGGLGVTRRAATLSRSLLGRDGIGNADDWIDAIRKSGPNFQDILKWVSCFALAVNEENASFGRVVTAPTNGAAGVIAGTRPLGVQQSHNSEPGGDYPILRCHVPQVSAARRRAFFPQQP